jgi:hypothetical protein
MPRIDAKPFTSSPRRQTNITVRPPTVKAKLLEGKRGLIVGIATWALARIECPQFCYVADRILRCYQWRSEADRGRNLAYKIVAVLQ